jgi:hypothetical protein
VCVAPFCPGVIQWKNGIGLNLRRATAIRLAGAAETLLCCSVLPPTIAQILKVRGATVNGEDITLGSEIKVDSLWQLAEAR